MYALTIDFFLYKNLVVYLLANNTIITSILVCMFAFRVKFPFQLLIEHTINYACTKKVEKGVKCNLEFFSSTLIKKLLTCHLFSNYAFNIKRVITYFN